jgi:two-component sensor histidine kinase
MDYLKLLLLFFLTLTSNAQNTKPSYTVKWVNSENGLKQQSIRYCVADNNGFVWIGTELGLYRYDGKNIKEIEERNFPSLNKQRIINLGKDNMTGKIYLLTNPEDFQYVIDHNTINRIAPEKNKEKAIITFNNFSYAASNPIVKRVLNHSKIKYFLKEYFNVSNISACLTSHFFYLPQYDHLIAFNKNGLIKKDYPFSSNFRLLQFGEIVLAIDNKRVKLIHDGEISSKKIKIDERIQSYLDRESMNQSSMEIFGDQNRYYLKYNGGIYQIQYFNNSLNTQFLFNTPALDISSINYLEKENLYVVGTQTHGLAVLKPNPFNTLLFNESTTNKSINYCYSVAAIANNKWYSSSGWTFNPKTMIAKKDNFLIDNINIRFILPYKDKYYYNSKNELWNVENHKNDYDFVYPINKKAKTSGFSGYSYLKGQLYLTDTEGIYFLKNGRFISDIEINKKFNEKSINGIYSFKNDLIIPTTKGVFSYSPNTKKVAVIKGLENVNARYIKPINKNSYWVGCYGEGLFLVSHSKAYKVQDTNIDINTTHAIEEDIEGNLWISTNDGLLKIKKQIAIQKILKNNLINCYRYTTEDGLLTNEFNGGGTHPSLQTTEGIIGFPSMKGFVWFHPNKVPKHLFNGKIVMDQVLIDNDKTISQLNNTFFIPKETGVITFNFSYGYYYNRDNLSIRYRFRDQKKWTEIKGNSFQISRYKKGEQSLQIQIITHGFDSKLAVVQSFKLDFEARYYETFWFWVLVVALFLLVLYGAYLIGLQLHKRRENLLKKKIDEKTVKLQEAILELEDSKNSISKSLEEKKILLREVHHRVKNNLQLIISMLNIQARRKNYVDIYDFIQKGETRISSMALIHQNLYQSEDSLDKINFQLYAEDLVNSISKSFENSEDKIKIEVLAENIILNLNTAIPLGLIVNELVTNALKYAFPKNKTGVIRITILTKKLNLFELIIEDNGIGFDYQKLEKKSFGLELIRLLANQLNGNVVFDNSTSTKYSITFKEIIFSI